MAWEDGVFGQVSGGDCGEGGFLAKVEMGCFIEGRKRFDRNINRDSETEHGRCDYLVGVKGMDGVRMELSVWASLVIDKPMKYFIRQECCTYKEYSRLE